MSRYPNEVHVKLVLRVQEPRANGAREPWREQRFQNKVEVDEMIFFWHIFVDMFLS